MANFTAAQGSNERRIVLAQSKLYEKSVDEHLGGAPHQGTLEISE